MFGMLRDLKLGGGDSFSDRLSSRYTVFFLIMMGTFGILKTFLSESISCKVPAHFTSSDFEYVNKYCWSKAVYSIPDFDTPRVDPDDMIKHVSYYQWIPLFFFIQAFLFYFPRCLWKAFGQKCGLSVSQVVDICIRSGKQVDADASQKNISYVTDQLNRFLSDIKTANACFRGVYLIFVYLLIKLLYIGNLILQMFVINAFMRHPLYFFAPHLLANLISNRPWIHSHRLPKIINCDLKMRLIDSVHRYSVNCVLPLNTIYEILLTIFWFWLAYIAISSIISFLIWTFTSLINRYQIRFVKQRLSSAGNLDQEEVEKFVKNYLTLDGCFLLQMVADNSNDMVASQLIDGLWDRHSDNKKPLPPPLLPPPPPPLAPPLAYSLSSPHKEIYPVQDLK